MVTYQLRDDIKASTTEVEFTGRNNLMSNNKTFSPVGSGWIRPGQTLAGSLCGVCGHYICLYNTSLYPGV